MRTLLRNVFENYVHTRAKLYGRAKVVGTADQRALLEGLPHRIESHLLNRGLADLFKVEGSIGNGNIARVPWVGIFKTSVTKSAERGFYIVLLFAEDMSGCYLSLNQGITAVERLYTKSFALKKMREAATKAAEHLDRHPETVVGRIELRSTGDLARGYESAAIESFYYSHENPPSDQIFFQNLDYLMQHYDTLIQKFGTDLYSLFVVSEEEFQQVALEKAATNFDEPCLQENSVGGSTTSFAVLGSQGVVRSPRIAAEAIRAANFNCEIDPDHRTFTSRAKKMRYVEAHHLIPISQQKNFEYSLDVAANIVSLCATCHRLLHFGVVQEKKMLLKLLLKNRRSKLLEKSIDVAYNDFLQFYSSESKM
jgi:5-methylcytosine-specific restriction enzyme A